MNTPEDYLKRVIFHFLKLSRASIEDTKGFLALKHNDDLCPGLSQK